MTPPKDAEFSRTVSGLLILFFLATGAWSQRAARSGGLGTETRNNAPAPNTPLDNAGPVILPESYDRPLKFTSRSELVLIPVIVTDKSGQHVTGLTRDAFTVLESGQPQRLATFEEIKTTNQPLRRLTPRDEYTNQVPADAPRRVTIIVLDAVNTPSVEQGRARRELIRYLAENLEADQLTSLLIMDRRGVRVVHDFTRDTSALIAALKRITSTPPLPEDVGAIGADTTSNQREIVLLAAAENSDPLSLTVQQLQSFIDAVDAPGASYRQAEAVAITLESLQHIAQSYTGIPGRKALIWVTAGFPFTLDPGTGLPLGGSPNAALEHTFQMLNSANIAMYPVDVRGLVNFLLPTVAVAPNPHNLYSVNLFADAGSREHTAILATLGSFADMTGGRAFYNRNDLALSFKEASADSVSYYMLGYYLDKKNTKPGWRKLSVKVSRDGLHVRSRNGFLVTPATVDPEFTRQHDMRVALTSPLDYTGVPIWVHWLDQEPKGKKRKVKFEIVLPANTATIDDADSNRMSLDFAAVARTTGGDSAAQFSKTIQTRLKPEGVQQIRESGVTYGDVLELPQGSYEVRFVVRDNISGRTGSVAAPLKVQ